jgi:hypothetical protein
MDTQKLIPSAKFPQITEFSLFDHDNNKKGGIGAVELFLKYKHYPAPWFTDAENNIYIPLNGLYTNLEHMSLIILICMRYKRQRRYKGKLLGIVRIAFFSSP